MEPTVVWGSLVASNSGRRPRPGETLSTYLPRADAELVRERAAAGGRSVAAEIAVAVRAQLRPDGQGAVAERAVR